MKYMYDIIYSKKTCVLPNANSEDIVSSCLLSSPPSLWWWILTEPRNSVLGFLCWLKIVFWTLLPVFVSRFWVDFDFSVSLLSQSPMTSSHWPCSSVGWAMVICSRGLGLDTHWGQRFFLFLSVWPFLFYGYCSEGIIWDTMYLYSTST